MQPIQETVPEDIAIVDKKRRRARETAYSESYPWAVNVLDGVATSDLIVASAPACLNDTPPS